MRKGNSKARISAVTGFSGSGESDSAIMIPQAKTGGKSGTSREVRNPLSAHITYDTLSLHTPRIAKQNAARNNRNGRFRELSPLFY